MAFLTVDKTFLRSPAPVLARDIEAYPEGLILPVDKPYRWTSADVVRKLKFLACRYFQKKNLKVGHAGTLDPLATGVLLVCIGKATREAEALQRHEKEYLAGLSFGATTPSYDLEKEPDRFYPTEGLTKERLDGVLQGFLGEQEQIAPLFSAKSVEGIRAYEMARKMYKKAKSSPGEDTAGFDKTAEELLSRQRITISDIRLESFLPQGRIPQEEAEASARSARIHVADISDFHFPHADIRITCSKGTYIRALARDIGEALDTGAFLDSLRRTRSGDFRVENALDMEEVADLMKIVP